MICLIFALVPNSNQSTFYSALHSLDAPKSSQALRDVEPGDGGGEGTQGTIFLSVII